MSRDASEGTSRGTSLPSELALARVVGRYAVADGVRFAWPGTAVQVEFEGTGLDVELDDTGHTFWNVSLDGRPKTVLATSPTERRYTLASDLPIGHHALRLTKRTESMVGVVTLRRFAAREGSLSTVPDAALRHRRIEFVGDSITCGFGNLADRAEDPFMPSTEDESLAYGALTAAQLDAEHTAIAYSGIGVYRNHAGDVDRTMAVRFERALADDPASVYRFDDPPPDAVVVNLGTNDYASGDPGPAFERAYIALLRQLRGHYPGVRIVATVSAMLSDAYPPGVNARTKATQAIREAVQALHDGGDPLVTSFQFEETRREDGFGAQWHPSRASHRRMADQLAPFLRAALNW